MAKKVIKTQANEARTPSQMMEILRFIIQNNLTVGKVKGRTIAYGLVGEAGISKTSICEQVASEFNMPFKKLNAAQIYEPTELTGYPIKEVLSLIHI